MPIRIDQIENGHIVRFVIDDPWSADEIPEAKETARALFRQARHTVHALADLRHAAMSMALVMAAQQVIGGEPFPNAGQIAVVGISSLMRFMAAPILRLSGGADTVSFFDTSEQAVQYLRRCIETERPNLAAR
ncbi:MAG TPA: hypothetical protein VMT34_08865 [Aggregatilineales bacterium]|nr:hypothetical protein [Aggregatilineales bacterium]